MAMVSGNDNGKGNGQWSVVAVMLMMMEMISGSCNGNDDVNG